jgi:hypothetical protein
MPETDSLVVKWYGERGIVNALLGHIQRSSSPIESFRTFVRGIRWADGGDGSGWTNMITNVVILVEVGLADFGNPDLTMIMVADGQTHCLFVEAKIGPYILAMRPNNVGMLEPGFNSGINGQLSLKYRFARALEGSPRDAENVTESPDMLKAYQKRVRDPRQLPRRLAKPEIVQHILRPNGLVGLAEEFCHYVALTWDTEARAFFRDASVVNRDGLPCFLDAHGEDGYSRMRGRVGWLGYQTLEQALVLGEDREYQAAFRTMLATLEPDPKDYAVAESAIASRATPESLALAARLAQMFAGYKAVEYPGSYSIKDGGQTVAKVIPRQSSVFVGVRGDRLPATWEPGPAETVSVQGVPFTGIAVPVDRADSEDLSFLQKGLAKP